MIANMKKINVKQSRWNLAPLFKGDNDPEMENKRKIVEQKSYEFINGAIAMIISRIRQY